MSALLEADSFRMSTIGPHYPLESGHQCSDFQCSDFMSYTALSFLSTERRAFYIRTTPRTAGARLGFHDRFDLALQCGAS